MGKVILKTEKTSRFGKTITMTELGSEPVKVSENGTLIVESEEIAKQIVESGTGWDYLKKKTAEGNKKVEAPAAPANEDEGNEDEGNEDESGNDDDVNEEEDIAEKINAMTSKELNAFAEEMEFDKLEGWNPAAKVSAKKEFILAQLTAEEEE